MSSGITGEQSGRCVVSRTPTADTETHVRGDGPAGSEQVSLRLSLARCSAELEQKRNEVRLMEVLCSAPVAPVAFLAWASQPRPLASDHRLPS